MYFNSSDYSKITMALAKKKERLASQLKADLSQNAPNEYHAQLFLELLSVCEAEREAVIAEKVGNHTLLGPLSNSKTMSSVVHVNNGGVEFTTTESREQPTLVPIK
jgi:hypothetical protein